MSLSLPDELWNLVLTFLLDARCLSLFLPSLVDNNGTAVDEPVPTSAVRALYDSLFVCRKWNSLLEMNPRMRYLLAVWKTPKGHDELDWQMEQKHPSVCLRCRRKVGQKESLVIFQHSGKNDVGDDKHRWYCHVECFLEYQDWKNREYRCLYGSCQAIVFFAVYTPSQEHHPNDRMWAPAVRRQTYGYGARSPVFLAKQITLHFPSLRWKPSDSRLLQ